MKSLSFGDASVFFSEFEHVMRGGDGIIFVKVLWYFFAAFVAGIFRFVRFDYVFD